jgi:transcription elongation factor S-II
MEQRELESRVKQLMKCVNNNEPPETALRMLDELKKDASPTEDQLRVCFLDFLP